MAGSSQSGQHVLGWQQADWKPQVTQGSSQGPAALGFWEQEREKRQGEASTSGCTDVVLTWEVYIYITLGIIPCNLHYILYYDTITHHTFYIHTHTLILYEIQSMHIPTHM